ncbi:XRE family transcriptional regulator [Lichenibacterium dinghuense]|uniref:XRE family transcriptional regulator n=1 Tax=Lichenibacterium dinghuense TaxID=2895977 RepID=UPI001F2EF5BE|nr:XRE family transcriptional regulator [Lichenibacterium sp. 6Y81]
MAHSASSGEQALLRAARAALGWSYVETSRRAQVSIGMLLSAEGKRERPAPATSTAALWRAYEQAGVGRLDGGSGGCGIILRIDQV